MNNETLIASNYDRERLKNLSRRKTILCPRCKSNVVFKAGKVKAPHFAHSNSDCVITNYEPETYAHLKGKQVLYEWLRQRYPSAEVEYEVFIPETNQIADVFIEHYEGDEKGLRWAFEFQHSPLSSSNWEARHELYKAVDIQDFWVLDATKYLKFSKAQDHEDARRRNELEKKIFSKTGLCYFLDLDTLDLTIDFNFIQSTDTKTIKGKRIRTSYTYHSPLDHSMLLDSTEFKLNAEFKHAVLIHPKLEKQMKEPLSHVLAILKKNRRIKEEKELQERTEEKLFFLKKVCDDEQKDNITRFFKSNEEILKHDILSLSKEEFFAKYVSFLMKIKENLKEYSSFQENDNLIEKLLKRLVYSSDLYSLNFLNKQEEKTLKTYLSDENAEKIKVVTYVYKKYLEDLEKLSNFTFKMIKSDLEKISYRLTPWESNPTALDFAIEYKCVETTEEADAYMQKIKVEIIDYDPLDGLF